MLFAEFTTERVGTQRGLRESQARLELAVRAGSMGIYDFNVDAGAITWDARVRELFGLSLEEKISYEDTFLATVHPDDVEFVDRTVREALSPGSDGILQHEYRIVNRVDGSIRWLAAFGRVYREERQPVRLIGVVQDITDRKRAELALEQTAEELRRADERKNAYLATLSHELRNPLAPIRTAAQLLTSPQLTADQLAWVAQVIRRQTGHMATLLEDLLDITRISRGRVVLRREHVPLSSIVQSATESARELIDAKRHGLLVTLPVEAVTVYADPLRLSQVLVNLLLNAAKYTDPGGRIELTAVLEKGSLVIRVRDNGIGISPESLGKIFTMFWQADSGSDGQGLGIGLAFVESLVHLHGGTIEARSKGPGHGSEFIVRLPVEEGAAAAAAAPCAPALPHAGDPLAMPRPLRSGAS
jgi:PAS domain S-box-containing protein